MGVFFIEETTKSKTSITNVAQKEINLLNRHLDVLQTVKDNGPIGIIRLSQLTGQPQHIVGEEWLIIQDIQHFLYILDFLLLP